MKFSTAALLLCLSVPPSAEAFAPLSVGRSRYQQPATNIRSSPSFGLYSTTVKKTTSIDVDATASARTVTPPSSQAPLTELQAFLDEKQQKSDVLKNSKVPDEAHKSEQAVRKFVTDYLSQYEQQTGASVVYSKLVEHGVTVVNGFSGGAVLPLLDQFHPSNPRHGGKVPPIRWITNSNESSAGHIAEGYAKSMPLPSSQGEDKRQHLPVGVVVATSGPGVTNLITPLQDAICDGVPLVVLCGQAATTAPPDAFQQAPAVELTTPCTKWSYQIRSAAEIPLVMDYAFYVARNGRPGPVFIDLPKDLLNQVVTPSSIQAFVESDLSTPFSSNLMDASSSPFARIVKRPENAHGESTPILHLGRANKSLPFEIVLDQQSFGQGRYQLRPIARSGSSPDTFHADHHPTNRIIRVDTVINGVEKKSYHEGALDFDSSLTQELVQLILQAEKPIIIAGQGCNDSPDELKELAEKLQIPVTTTLHALGCFDERHPLALNMLGMHGHPTPNFMVQDSDLVLCIGSRFDDRITGRMGDFIPKARQAAREGRGGVVHVDIRLTEMSKQVEPTYFVHSTGRSFLRTLNEAVRPLEVKPRTDAWLAKMKELQRNFPVKIPVFASESFTVKDGDQERIITKTKLSAQSVVSELNRQLLAANKMDDCLFTTGVGVHQMVAAQLITWTRPRQMLSSGSLGTMGVALGYCIGAKLANWCKIVIAVDGDGSFNMTFTELKTVAEEKIPIKIMILDNDGQMMVEYWQRLFHENRLLAVRNGSNPDYSMLAKAFGIKSIYCNSEEDLPAKMEEFLFADPDEPVLFHVHIERTPCLPLVAPGQPLDKMILEDVEVDVDGAAAPS